MISVSGDASSFYRLIAACKIDEGIFSSIDICPTSREQLIITAYKWLYFVSAVSIHNTVQSPDRAHAPKPAKSVLRDNRYVETRRDVFRITEM